MKEKCDKIRVFLYENRLSQAWLIDRLYRAGLETSKTELSEIIAGRRKGPKAVRIADMSLEVLATYGAVMNGQDEQERSTP